MSEQKERCLSCFKKGGLCWDSTSDNDLREGICPKKSGKSGQTCGITGKKLKPTRRVNPEV